MKRLICLIIVAAMLFAAACNNSSDAGTSGADVSEGASETESSAAAQSEPESDPKAALAAEQVAKIDALLTGGSDRNMGKDNVLYKSYYESSAFASEEYPDRGRLLTDGESPVAFDKSTWVGYYKPAANGITIDFDLGKTVGGILDFRTDVLNHVSYGIGVSSKVTYYVAGEDKEYVCVGTAYPPSDMQTNEAYDFPVNLQNSISARYIRVSISGGSSVWLFVGEISAYAYDEKYKDSDEKTGVIKSADYYGASEVPLIEEEKNWDKSVPDYDKTINLAAGRRALVFAGSSLTEDIATDWFNTKNTALLTDSRKASLAAISDGSWMHFTRGDSREIVVDLGAISAVSGFSAGFLKDTQPGVRYPRYIRLAVSLDGREWQTLYSAESVNGSTAASEITRVSETFKHSTKARYAKLSFIIDVHAYVDEIEIFGKKNVSGAKDIVPDSPDDKASLNGSYITPADFDGVHNMLLSYNCIPNGDNHSENGLITPEEYLPYTAYLDASGKITDTFFDAFLYLPYTSFNYSANGKTAAGWRFYLDDIFFEGRNMNALEECVQNVKTQLRREDYKVKVYTPVLYTFPTVDDRPNKFGDIDGDGTDEDFSKIEDRKKAIKWIMDETLARFKAGNYKNLDFKGYYWFEESINYSDPHETQLIKYASEYAHKLGYKLFWIPYQSASGYADWKALGFDLACMQPNYMFRSNLSSEILYTNAEITRLLGMCVEMEISDPTNKNNAARFHEYMVAGAQTGYMNAVKIYYQDGVPGAFHTACYSKEPSVRKIYDDLYLFANEKFEVAEVGEVSLPSGSKIELSGKAGKAVSGKIELGEFSEYGDSLTVAVSPRYGSVRVNHDGSFAYYPLQGFTGKDSFAICIDLGHTSGAVTEVTVTVG